MNYNLVVILLAMLTTLTAYANSSGLCDGLNGQNYYHSQTEASSGGVGGLYIQKFTPFNENDTNNFQIKYDASIGESSTADSSIFVASDSLAYNYDWKEKGYDFKTYSSLGLGFFYYTFKK